MKVFKVAVSKGLVERDARAIRIMGAPSEVPLVIAREPEGTYGHACAFLCV